MIDRQGLAIVLKVTPHGEADKIVTLYSSDLGKITAIAKGAKRSKQRFVNKLEPYTFLRIFYRAPKRGNLFFLQEAELLNAYLSLRSLYPCYVTAAFITELLQRFSGEHDPDPDLLSLINWAFESLDQGAVPATTATFFLLHLLGLCGYQPQLNHCSCCKQTLGNSITYTLHPGNGTLICKTCHSADAQSSFFLSLQTLKFLQRAQQIPLQQVHRLQLPPASALQALTALHYYCRHLLQQDIHSWKQFWNIIS